MPPIARLKSYGLVLVVNVFLLVLCVAAADVVLWQRGLRPYQRTYPGQVQGGHNARWARSDPRLGWTLNPDNFAHEINPQGFRDPSDFDHLPAAGSAIRVMVLGDSFVAGSSAVNVKDTIPGQLREQLRDLEVFSLAVPGWGVDQMYLAFERYKDAIEPQIVVLFFIDDDVKRVLEAYRAPEQLNKPSFTVTDGALASRAAASPVQSAFDSISGKSILFSLLTREVYLGTDARAVVGQVFQNLGREMAHEDGKAVVVRIPTRDNGHLATSLRRRLYDFESFVAGSGTIYLDAAAAITGTPEWQERFYIEDGHLNADGTRAVVNFLVEEVF